MQNVDFASELRDARDLLVLRSLENLAVRMPQAWQAWDAAAREACRRDFGHHIDYLAEAVGFSAPELFANYKVWLQRLLAGLGLPPTSFAATMACLEEALASTLSPAAGQAAATCLAAQVVASHPEEETGVNPLAADATRFLSFLLEGKRHEAGALVLDLVEGGVPIASIYLDIVQASLREVGRLWMDGVASVAEEHYCTAAAQAILAQLYPRVFTTRRNGLRMLAACVGDELHEVGIRMVADLFELDGWDSELLGANTPARAILSAVSARGARLVCLSATMTRHVSLVEEAIALVRGAFPRERVAIMVGGHPFIASPGLWAKVGADAFAADAREAVRTAAGLVGLALRGEG